MISVIIPVYNGEEFIERSIKSCLSQTYSDIEIIVVDDGSTDGTKEVVEELIKGNNNLRLIKNEHGGVCKARNTGIENANGEWISFLDADDVLFDDCFEILTDISKNGKFDIVIGGLTSGTRKESKDFNIWQNKESIIKYLEDNPCFYSSCGKLYSINFLSDIRFVEGHIVNEDAFFNFECCLKEPKIACTQIEVYKYINRRGSVTRSAFSAKKCEDIMFFANERIRLIKEHYPELLENTVNFTIKVNMVMLWNTACYFNKEYKIIQKNAKKYIRKNKRYFIPAIKKDKFMFRLVKYRLYWLYKIYAHLRRNG